MFLWNKEKQKKVQPVKRSALEKLDQGRAKEEEATDTIRKILIYWDITTRKSSVVDTEKLFEGGTYDQDEIGGDEDLDNTTVTRPSTHKKSMEDGFPLVLMKLRMGLSTIDLPESFLCHREHNRKHIPYLD
ncbi:unnamed protein product [Pocillopora meandrina]|uniref:Uncharacterized protein n=1 Tax=Pocillopora meandrina TaxID=46732 RepID=A0AAU9VQE7_9CNID|nr:unnamed protein product [Pocillopora meandrina]